MLRKKIFFLLFLYKSIENKFSFILIINLILYILQMYILSRQTVCAFRYKCMYTYIDVNLNEPLCTSISCQSKCIHTHCYIILRYALSCVQVCGYFERQEIGYWIFVVAQRFRFMSMSTYTYKYFSCI